MATFNFNKANLAAAQIPASITSSQTSITVDSGDAATFPTPPFFATIMPAGGVPNTLNSEIVQVTAVNTSTGVLTITRAQRGSTAKQQDEGAVIMNGVYIEDLAQAQAVGKSFFSATLSSSVYYIQDARLTTTPENGDSIRVVFDSDWTNTSVKPSLSLNSGTASSIYAGNNIKSSGGSLNTGAMVKSGVIYELTYYNGAWYILNLVANSSITSDNVDWATFIDKIYPVGAIYSTVAQSTAAQVKTALGGVGTWVAWGSGRVPLGVGSNGTTSYNSVEATGGSPYLQQHRHTTQYGDFGVPSGSYGVASNTSSAGAAVYTGSVDTSAAGGSVSVGNAGNMPPYITCYMWKRTA